MGLPTYGVMGVDWEERVRFDRLREERLARIKALLAASEMGALLCFDMTNIRYVTATHIGTWAQDKLNRFCLLPQGDEPIMWDFGSAARHHQLYNPWLGDGRSRAGISALRGAMSPESGRAEDVARRSGSSSRQRGLLGEPVGVDAIEPPVLFALQAEGIQVVDGQQLMQEARMIKTRDEITLLNTACMMVDAAYEELYRAMRPGMRENECVALVNKVLYDMGSELVEGVNAISGERCIAPPPRLHRPRAASRRPGLLRHPAQLQRATGRATTARSRWPARSRALVDAYKRCRYYLDAAIALIRPGVTTAEVVVGLAARAGVRLPGRGGRVRAAVRPRRRAGDLGEADLLPAGVARPPRGDPGGDGLRAGDVLAGVGRLVGGADRGAARGDQGRLRGDHAVPGRGPDRGRQALLHGGRHPAVGARATVEPEHRARRRRHEATPRVATRAARRRSAAARPRPRRTARSR